MLLTTRYVCQVCEVYMYSVSYVQIPCLLHNAKHAKNAVRFSSTRDPSNNTVLKFATLKAIYSDGRIRIPGLRREDNVLPRLGQESSVLHAYACTVRTQAAFLSALRVVLSRSGNG